MKTYNVAMTEEQRMELIRLVGRVSTDALTTRKFLQDHVVSSEPAIDEVADEVNRLAEVWSTLYTRILLTQNEAA